MFLEWSQVANAVDYQVTVKDGNGQALLTQPAPTTARAQRVEGLTADVDYTFSVVARNGSRVSPDSNELIARPSRVVSTPVITRATWKARDFRIEGTTNVASGTITIFRFDTTTAQRGAQIGTPVNVTPAVLPETGGEFILRLRDAAAGPGNPGWIVAVANDGAQSPPFQVTNK